MTTPRNLIALAALGSAGLLAGAFIFQALGYPPCAMCLWQRWPHAAAVAVGLVGALVPSLLLAAAGALAAVTTAGLGVFHTGVERGWWDGPASCSSTGVEGLSAEELLNQILTAPIVRCDEVAWAFAGLSMATWNAILSAGLAAVWVLAVRKLMQQTA